jgi:hypothetical protein
LKKNFKNIFNKNININIIILPLYFTIKNKINTMYSKTEKQPEEGQLVICRCPNWNEEGYQIAQYENGEFAYCGQPNNMFDENVIAWLPLLNDEETLLMEVYKRNSDKYKILEDKVAKCYVDDNGDELSEEESKHIDLGTIGEITAYHFGWF